MYKITKRMNFALFCCLLASLVSLSGCSYFKNDQYSATENFNPNPSYYKQAQATKNIKLPKYIANNIDPQPYYPIPNTENLNGSLEVSKLPPTLEGKIREYG